MKKKTLLASIILASAALSLAACGQSNPTSTPTSNPTSTATSTPVKDSVTVKAHYNPSDATYDKEVELDLVENILTGNKCATFTDIPTDDYRKFLGWYEDAQFTTPLRAEITDDIEVFAKWESKGTVEKSFRFDGTQLTKGVGLTGSIYNFTSADDGGERNKATVNALGEAVSGNQPVVKNGVLEIKAPADGTLYMVLENGSGGSASQYSVTSSDNEYKDHGVCDFVGKTDAYTAKRFEINLKKDVTYTFTKTNGTIYVYDLYMKANVELSPISDIKLTSKGTVDYIEGQEYDGSKVNVDLVYENKSTEPADMSKVSIDTSTLDMTKTGVQKVTVKYPVTQNLYGTIDTKELTQEIEINVYSLESISLGFNAVLKGSNTVLGGNGQYINNTVKVVYKDGETYSSANLTVFANCLLNTQNKDFTVSSSDYTIDNETSFTGSEVKKTITVTFTSNGKTKTVSYDVYVVTTAPSVVNNVVQVAVNQKYTGTIGEVVDGYNTFTSIQQALDYLSAYSKSIEGKAITLKIGEGTYNEKLEFTLPNMTVVGAGKDKTIIEWDSLYGLKDESGFVHTTDSTQTVAVRESAENFTISGVTISNYWNDRSKYIASGIYGATAEKNSSEHRALALLIQADKFIMDDCKVLGMQDTIELFTGRQLIKNTYICGTTDFIFGSNNTTLFQGCTIEVKASEDNKTGGYITAFKGYSKGEIDAVNVGVIFNECTFKAEAGVPDESVAIARPWGNYSFVGVMNSELGKCIAKGTTVTEQKNKYEKVDTTTVTAPVEGTTYYVADGNNYVVANVTEWAAETVYYTKTATASRYYNGLTKTAFDLDKNSHKPTVKFFEYNNQGAGAMTDEDLAKIVATYTEGEETKTGRLVYTLTNEQAAKFVDQKYIFAKDNNPNIKYQDNWAGDIEADVTVNFYWYDTDLYTTVKDWSGNKLILPEDPEYTGMVFDSWYTDQELENEYDLNKPLEEGTLNLYANFLEANTVTDTHTFDVANVTGLTEEKTYLAPGALSGADWLTVQGKPNSTDATLTNTCYYTKDGVTSSLELDKASNQAEITEGTNKTKIPSALKFEVKGDAVLTIDMTSNKVGTNEVKIGVGTYEYDGTKMNYSYLTPTSNTDTTATTDKGVVTTVNAGVITYKITTPGTYYILNPGSRAVRIKGITLVDTYAVAAQTLEYTFDWNKISTSDLTPSSTSTVNPEDGTTVAEYNVYDKATLSTAAFLKGFGDTVPTLEVLGGLTYRDGQKYWDAKSSKTKSNPETVELKTDNTTSGIKITIAGAGTITIAFSSTGSSNLSRIGLLDSDGKYVDGVLGELGSIEASKVTEDTTNPTEVGSYQVKGTTAVEITFTVSAGTYTIVSPSATTGRGCRINELSIVDAIGGNPDAGIMPLPLSLKKKF